jgi:WD40 repeat protein
VPLAEPPPAPPTKNADAPPGAGKQTRTDRHGDALPAGAIARLGTVRLRREDGAPCDFDFTPDGKALVSARNHKVVQFWDARTGEPLQAFRHEKPFDTFALSADGKILAAAGTGGITVWDVVNRKPLRRIGAARVDWIAIASDGKTLATVGGDKFIHLWDTATGKQKGQFAGRAGEVRALLFSSDGKTLIFAAPWAILAWDVASGREVRKIETDGAGRVALSPDSTVLATGGTELVKDKVEARLFLWDMASGRKLRQLQGHKNFVDSVAFSPDGKTLASAEVEIIHLWDVATGKEIRRIEKTGWIKRRLVFSPDGQTLASTAPGNETVIRLWDVATGRPLQPAGPDGVVRSVAFSPDGRIVATGAWLGYDRTLRLWDASTGLPVWEAPAEVGFINRILFTPDGRGVFSSSIDGTLRLWDVRTGKIIRRYPIPEKQRPVIEIALSADGRRLTSIGEPGGEARASIVWDVGTGKRLLQREGQHPAFLNILSFSADAEIVAEPEGKLLHLRGVSTGQLLLNLELSDRRPGEHLLEPVAFSPDGRTVAAITAVYVRGPRDYELKKHAIHLWELASGKTILRIAEGDNQLNAVAFSPDGRALAAAGKGVIQLLDVATGKELLAYRGQESQVFLNALAFSPDGKKLAAGYWDSTTLVWDVPPGIRRALPNARDRIDLDRAWSDLASQDAANAHAAIWALVAAPEQALRLLHERLKPVEAVDPRRIRRLLAELDSNEFAVRAAAAKELEQIGDQAELPLHEALRKKPSLEVRRRVEALLARPRIVRDAELLRRLRAIEILERIGTPEALRLLQGLAKGAPHARATRDAKASLDRLARRAAIRQLWVVPASRTRAMFAELGDGHTLD